MKRKKGFTLVELLIAITILGIILVLAIPTLTNIKNKDVETQGKIYENALLNAGKMYNDGYVFYRSTSGVWLTDSVPQLYLEEMNVLLHKYHA